jgi:hypothetical protein
VREVRAANYAETAVATHRSYLDGNLTLGTRSDSPEQVTSWFTGKIPFQFRLPNAQSVGGSSPTYHLTGASLVSYRGSPVALVIYEKQKEKISLWLHPVSPLWWQAERKPAPVRWSFTTGPTKI